MTKPEEVVAIADEIEAKQESVRFSPSEAHQRVLDVENNIAQVFFGKSELVRLTLACVFGTGHLLLEDVPGVGKTTLALAVARSLGLNFKRIQFTSDLLPSDILGVSIYSQHNESFEFRPGPIFSEVVLADEINRTAPRTQSALLEAMSEGRVSVDNITHPLPSPFVVIATQNPREHYGTYPLPESQLDRFLMRISVGYPETSVERKILLQRRTLEPVHQLDSILRGEEVLALQHCAARVSIEESIIDYIMRVVEQTRIDTRVRIGVSTRGALALTRAARALAMVNGRNFVIPDDVQMLIVPCLAHRLSLTTSVGTDNREHAEVVMKEIASQVVLPV